MRRKLFMSVLGMFIYAISVNNLSSAEVGERPIDLLIMTLEKILRIDNYLIIYILIEILFLIALLLLRKKLKVTHKEMIISFLSISFLSLIIYLTRNFIFIRNTYFYFIIILLLLNFGLFLITQGNLIITPLDKFLVHLSNLFKASYGKFRLFFDILITVILQVLTLSLYKQNSITLELILVIVLSGPIIHLYERIYYRIRKNINKKLKRKKV